MDDKWLKNDQGLYLSPGRQRSAEGHAARRRKKHRTNCDKFYGRKLHRFCPICNTELTTKNVIHENFFNKREGKIYTRALFVCKDCKRIWESKETIKVWRAGRKKTLKNISNAEFKRQLIGVEYE